MTASASMGTALITGASTGIGAIYADRLARRGYDLILVARNRERLEAIADNLVAQTGRAVDVMLADLNNPGDLGRVEQRLRSDDRITLLVNNAGVAVITPLLSSDVDRMQAMVDLNVTALMRLTAAAAPGFVARGRGAFINIGSVVGIAPEILGGVYGGTKAFVLAFSQSLRHELSEKGVRVQVVMPGATSTGLWALAGAPVETLPTEIVMSAQNMVDAALAGFDQGEFATIPALENVELWNAFDRARLALHPHLSLKTPAARYTRQSQVP